MKKTGIERIVGSAEGHEMQSEGMGFGDLESALRLAWSHLDEDQHKVVETHFFETHEDWNEDLSTCCENKGWIHVDHSDSKPWPHVERCDECAKFDTDVEAESQHGIDCRCELDDLGGPLCPKCEHPLFPCSVGDEDMHCRDRAPGVCYQVVELREIARLANAGKLKFTGRTK